MIFSSPQNRRVAQGILEGFTNREIGDALGISERTVKAHIRMLAVNWHVDRMRNQKVQLAIKIHTERPDICPVCNPGVTSLCEWKAKKQVWRLHAEPSVCKDVLVGLRQANEATMLDLYDAERSNGVQHAKGS